MSAGIIVAALLLPPLAIFLDRGIGRDFWIALGLTCLGYLPGVVFALFRLLRKTAPADPDTPVEAQQAGT